MAHVIVERSFDPPLTAEEQMARAGRLMPCLGTGGIRWIRSYVSNDRRYGVCEYDAPDAEAVRVAHHTADVPFKRIWTGTEYTEESMR
jgi:hypothetical protein